MPRPAAADSYDLSPDGTVYTFHLRPDGRWSDGQPVTAKQFEYAWKRLLSPALKSEYAPLFVDAGVVGADEFNRGRARTPEGVGVHALDDATLQVRLVQPFGALLDLAALPVAAPVRPDMVESDPDGWGQDPSTLVGNGAFSISEWLHGDHITLRPNPEYGAHNGWPTPSLSKVTVTMATNPEEDLAGYRQGTRDWVQVPEAEVNQVLNDPGLAPQSRTATELTTFWVQVNTTRPPLDNVLVRRALARGIDREALVRDLAAGISVPTTSIIPPGMPGFQNGLGHELGFDAAGGRALLAQAGLAGGALRLTFSFAMAPDNLRRARYMQSQWSDHLGIDIELRGMETEEYERAIADQDYDLAFGGWAPDYPDPRDWFALVLSCSGAYNRTGYCNPDFDQLVARADISAAQDERLALYNQAQTLLTQDAPVLPLFVRGRLVLTRPSVQSIDGGPLPITSFDEYPGSLLLDKVQFLPDQELGSGSWDSGRPTASLDTGSR